MKSQLTILTLIFTLISAQQVLADCTPIATPATCDYYSNEPIQHASCIRSIAAGIQLGGSVALPDGDLLLAGGLESARSKTIISSRAFIYNLQSKSLCETTRMITARNQGFTPVLLTNGKVLVAGGWTNHNAVADAETYDPQTAAWSKVQSLPVKLAYYSLTLDADSNPVISEGYIPSRRGQTMTANTESFVFDSKTNTFSVLP